MQVPMLEALSLDRQTVMAQEEAIRLRVRELPDAERKAYHDEFNRHMKDPDTYAVLNYFFVTGLHHFYLGRHARGAVNLGGMLIGVVLLFTFLAPLGWLMIGAIMVVELMALFRAQVVVADHNNRLAESILEQVRHHATR